MSNLESTFNLQPTPEGSAMLAALAAKYKEKPMTDSELGRIWLQPQKDWPEGLADKVEALLNAPPPASIPTPSTA